MTRNVVVAKALSKKGGKCRCGCERMIPPMGVIYKIAAEGRTTSSGHGPGFWVGIDCAAEYPDPRGLFEERNLFNDDG